MKKLLYIILSLLPLSAFAHVKYVVEHDMFIAHSGVDYVYLASVFTDKYNLAIMLTTLIAVCLLVLIVPQVAVVRASVVRIRERLNHYRDYLPWMARLSLGIALLGAGAAQAFLSPALPAMAPMPFVQILLGFFILAGFMLVPSMICVIWLYLVGLTQSTYLLGNFDILALAIGYLGLNDERPGIDDIFNFKPLAGFTYPAEFVPVVLRAGIGLAMVYLALYEKLLNPHVSELVVTMYNLTSVLPVSPSMWVVSAGLVELLVGLFLLLGLWTRTTTVVAFAVLSLSFFFFNEAVSSHVTLFGILSMVFVLGGGRYSIDNYWARRTRERIAR